MLFPKAEHAANAPETWRVVKIDSCRRWQLQTLSGGVLDTFTTKRDAEAAKQGGFMFTLYHKEKDWYAGKNIAGWKPYAQVEAEDNARRARQIARAATEATAPAVEASAGR